MAYQPIQLKRPHFKIDSTTSLMSKKGINLLESPQLLKPEFAQTIDNYLLTTEGGLEKRPGNVTLDTVGGTYGLKFLEAFTSNYLIFSVVRSLKVYDIANDATTTIKTYPTTDHDTGIPYEGQAYGGYFFMCGYKEGAARDSARPISRLYRKIPYDALTSDFTAGKAVEGGTSGATANILENVITYTAAYLTGGNAAQSTPATWAAVTDGSFAITIDGTTYNIDGVNFTGDASMADVAATIEDAIQKYTYGFESVVWSTNHFIITSGDETSISAITVTSTSTGTVGTDISGAGGADWMDCDAGNGVVTNAVITTTGFLVITDEYLTFLNNEIITDTLTGSAIIASATGVEWEVKRIPSAPICNHIKVVGNRLIAGNLIEDETAIHYSAVDDGTNPPFTNWTIGTAADDPGILNFRRAGAVNAISTLNDNIVIFGEHGKWAFYINTIDSAGTLTKVDVTTMSRIDFGGANGSLTTPKGLFYVNEGGLWQLLSVGQSDVVADGQDYLTSRLLGNDYFDGIDLGNTEIMYAQKYNSIFLSVDSGSGYNDKIIGYNLDLQAFFTFSGWNMKELLNVNETFYGMASTGTNTIYQLFTGVNDSGANITTSYEQELQVGGLNSRKQLKQVYAHGELNAASSISLDFDIYDIDGIKSTDKLKYTWAGITGKTEVFAGGAERINNFQRIILKISEASKLPHTITYVSLLTREKRQIRRRNLTT